MEELGHGAAMEEDYEIEQKKQAAVDVLSNYSKFVLACLGSRVQPCDMRLQLMKEASGIPTSAGRVSYHRVPPPDALGGSSSSGTARLEKGDSFQAP